MGVTGCFPFAEGEEEEIVDRYYVRGNTSLINAHIGYEDEKYGGIGLINGPITATGHNEDYIIAERKTDTASFFILKVIRTGVHSDAEKAITGPLGKIAFEQKLKKLGLEKSLQFNERYRVK